MTCRTVPPVSVLLALIFLASLCTIGFSSPVEKHQQKIHLKIPTATEVEERSISKSSSKDPKVTEVGQGSTGKSPSSYLKTRQVQSEKDSAAPLFNGLVLTDALFSYGDVNKDGRLTLEEIYNFYKNIIGFVPSLAESTAANLVLIGDKNKDGVLDWKGVLYYLKDLNPSEKLTSLVSHCLLQMSHLKKGQFKRGVQVFVAYYIFFFFFVFLHRKRN